MCEDSDVSSFELIFEKYGGGLVFETGNYNAHDINIPTAQVVNQLEGVRIISYSKISPYFFSFYVSGIDAKHYIRPIFQFFNEPHFYIGIVAGQNPRSMIIKKKFAAELQIKLIVKPVHSLKNFSGLFFYIFFIVKSFIFETCQHPGRLLKLN